MLVMRGCVCVSVFGSWVLVITRGGVFLHLKSVYSSSPKQRLATGGLQAECLGI